MPQCLTKYHGEMDYDEQATLYFPRGLFAFETETRFLPIERPDLRPLVFLQSLSTQDLCFISVPVFVVDREYSLALKPEELAAVELSADRQPVIGAEVLCLVIVSIQHAGPTTANLMAPVVINRRNSKAIQALSLDQKYSHQTLLPEMAEEPVCS